MNAKQLIDLLKTVPEDTEIVVSVVTWTQQYPVAHVPLEKPTYFKRRESGTARLVITLPKGMHTVERKHT